MYFNLPRTIIVVMLIALAVFVVGGVRYLSQHNLPGISAVICVSIVPFALGGALVRRLS
jgi:hypothetical protein